MSVRISVESLSGCAWNGCPSQRGIRSEAGLNRERILLLHPRQGQNALALAEEALKLGRSHTVISWLHPVENSTRQRLAQAANAGGAQSLNISLG